MSPRATSTQPRSSVVFRAIQATPFRAQPHGPYLASPILRVPLVLSSSTPLCKLQARAPRRAAPCLTRPSSAPLYAPPYWRNSSARRAAKKPAWASYSELPHALSSPAPPSLLQPTNSYLTTGHHCSRIVESSLAFPGPDLRTTGSPTPVKLFESRRYSSPGEPRT